MVDRALFGEAKLELSALLIAWSGGASAYRFGENADKFCFGVRAFFIVEN